MHERGVVSAAAAQFLAMAANMRLSEVTVAIGPSLVQDVAAEAWAAAVLGSPAEGATVRWVDGSDVMVCFVCSHEYTGAKLDPCPRCGSDGLVAEAAPEIEVAGWLYEGER